MKVSYSHDYNMHMHMTTVLLYNIVSMYYLYTNIIIFYIYNITFIFLKFTQSTSDFFNLEISFVGFVIIEFFDRLGFIKQIIHGWTIKESGGKIEQQWKWTY